MRSMGDNGRPRAAANIYKNGRLKTGKELEEEIKRIEGLELDELVAESKPVTTEHVKHLKELTDGVDIDLDAKLSDE
jgi:hypothetical protein